MPKNAKHPLPGKGYSVLTTAGNILFQTEDLLSCFPIMRADARAAKIYRNSDGVLLASKGSIPKEIKEML